MAAELSTFGDKWIRRSAIGLIVVVATASFMLSYAGLVYLAIGSGIHQGLAFLLPLTVDGMLLLGSAETLHASLQGRKTMFGNLLVVFGVLLSVWGNIASAGNSSTGIQSQIVHAIAPTALFLSIEVAIRIIKFRITVSHEAQAAAQRKAEREAKRQKLMEQAEKKPAAARDAKSTGSSRSSAGEPDVAAYREIIENFDNDASKASKIEAVLRRFPEAKSSHIAQAGGWELKTVGTSIVRVRERLASESPESGSDANFHAIVKELATVGE